MAELTGSAGSMLGPVIGSALYTAASAAGDADELLAFAVPFLAVSPLPALCGLALRGSIVVAGSSNNTNNNRDGDNTRNKDGGGDGNDRHDGGGDGATHNSGSSGSTLDGTQPRSSPPPSPPLRPPRCRLFSSWTILLTCLAVSLSSMSFGTTQSTLAIRLEVSPLCFSHVQVGSVFLVSSLVYMISSYPLGGLVDRLGAWPVSSKNRLLALGLVAGLVTNAVAFALLGPAYVKDLAELPAGPLNRPGWVFAAAFLWGIADAVLIVFSLPLLLMTLRDPDDESGQASLTGLWMSAYASGFAIGPVAGSSMMTMTTPLLCRPTDEPSGSGQPPHSGNVSAALAGPAQCHSPHGGGAAGMDAVQHCFDGLATILIIGLLAVALVWLARVLCIHCCRRRGSGGHARAQMKSKEGTSDRNFGDAPTSGAPTSINA